MGVRVFILRIVKFATCLMVFHFLFFPKLIYFKQQFLSLGRVNNEAFVSLATNNGYALGALVLGHSLRSVNTNRQLALMITQEVDSRVR
jgi:hypothetical protein